MTALYVGLVLVIVAAFFAMLWLRREADRAWAANARMRAFREPWAHFQIELVDRLTPALRQMAAEMSKLAPALDRLGKAMREVEKR